MIRQLWQEIRAHRWAAALFAGCWLATWLVGATLWPEAIGLLHFPLVFAASVLAGWWAMRATAAWRRARLDGSIKQGLLAAALVMEVDLVVIAIADKLSAPHVAPAVAAPWWGAPAGALAFFLGFGAIAGMAGMLGGLLGGLLVRAADR